MRPSGLVLPAVMLAMTAPIAFAGGGAKAGEPDLSAAFGNTVVSTYPDGRKAHLWLSADGSYTAAGRRGKPSSGQWSTKGEQICLKQLRPVRAPFAYCTDPPQSDQAWSTKAVTGERITVRIIKGVVRG